jgi:hypothetical protein
MEGVTSGFKRIRTTCLAVISRFSGTKLAVLTLVGNADCLPTTGVP